MTRRSLNLYLVASALVMAGVVGVVASLPRWRMAQADVPSTVARQVVKPGHLTDTYISAVCYDWLFHTYDWDALNYTSRSQTALAATGPSLRPAFARMLKKQLEIVVAGNQTQESDIEVTAVTKRGSSWAVSFTVSATVWFGGFKANQRDIQGTLLVSISDAGAGKRSIIRIDDLDVSQDTTTPITDVSPAVPTGTTANRT